jgi:hypothetical protein
VRAFLGIYYPQKEDPYKTRAVSRGIVFVPEEGAFSESYRQVLSSSLNEDGTELVLSFHGIQHTVTIKGRVLDHIAVSFAQEELEIVGFWARLTGS